MAFQHQALNSAEAELAELRRASAKVGGSDPVEALREIDCEPETVRDGATKVEAGADQEQDAGRTYAEATASADDNWDGDAAAAYLFDAGNLGADRRRRLAAAEDTAAAGQRIADGLDALARSSASQATAIAGEAASAVQTVLHPPTLPGGAPVTDPLVRQLHEQRMAEAAARVRRACAEIEDAVRRNVEQIAELGDALDGLTEPVASTPAVA
ncbi:hypothetical protein [Actinophytocola sp.]|uniref:hypothetical protein n=1 Tax=Actinophytocola sp. TaxID=1872138 RepID=UPI003D6AAEBB